MIHVPNRHLIVLTPIVVIEILHTPSLDPSQYSPRSYTYPPPPLLSLLLQHPTFFSPLPALDILPLSCKMAHPHPYLPPTPIAPAMDPDFLALKKRILKKHPKHASASKSSSYGSPSASESSGNSPPDSFSTTWFGPDDIVESLEWDEDVGEGYRRYPTPSFACPDVLELQKKLGLTCG